MNTMQKHTTLHVEHIKSWSPERIWQKWALSFEMITKRARVFRSRHRMTFLTDLGVYKYLKHGDFYDTEADFEQRNQPIILHTIPWLCGRPRLILPFTVLHQDLVFRQSIWISSNRWWGLCIGSTHIIIYVAYWGECKHRYPVKTTLTSITTNIVMDLILVWRLA